MVAQIKQLLKDAQQGVVRSVNSIMVQIYFELGRRIVEHELEGKDYSNYGDYLLESLSSELSDEFGKGFSKRKLELIRKFYLSYKIAKTVFSQSIGWSHYLHLMRIDNEQERRFYEIEKEVSQDFQNISIDVRNLSKFDSHRNSAKPFTASLTEILKAKIIEL